MSGFDGESGGHDHDRAIETGVAEGDSFLDAGDAEPVGSIAGGEPADGDEAVAVRIGFADKANFWSWADVVANDAKIVRHGGKVDLGPGSWVGFHGFILTQN